MHFKVCKNVIFQAMLDCDRAEWTHFQVFLHICLSCPLLKVLFKKFWTCWHWPCLKNSIMDYCARAAVFADLRTRKAQWAMISATQLAVPCSHGAKIVWGKISSVETRNWGICSKKDVSFYLRLRTILFQVKQRWSANSSYHLCFFAYLLAARELVCFLACLFDEYVNITVVVGLWLL